jgi:phosphatidate cytidylyltransferase
MALNVPTFFKRLGSSIVFVAVMLTGLLWNEWSFLGLVCLINFLCQKEYIRLMQKINKENYWPWWMPISVQIAGLISIVLVFGLNNHYLFNADKWLPAFAIIFIPAFMLFAILPKHTAWQAGMQSLFGILYIVVPMSLLILLRSIYPFFPLCILLLIWTNDTGAYLVGSFIGKHPFSEISPKKTWEGVIGGAVLTIVIAFGIGYFINNTKGGIYDLPAVSIESFIVYGLIVSVAGPAGDLLKSKFKRIAGVKDSGNLMPGHGGALDRFDSLIISTPFIFVCTYLFYSIH